MSLEFRGTTQAVEELGQANVEAKRELPKYSRGIGEIAISVDGFMMLEVASSPNEYMKEALEKRVIDQPGAVTALVEALDRTSVRLPEDKKPRARLAFLGPTGTGKSETAKTLAMLLGEGGGNLVKIDCSNYSNGHEVTALVGSPPSFVGHEIAPQLAKEKVEAPGTVILFDELEKGSPALFNLMLQILEDGQLRLNNGEVALFREAVVIVTSNLGAKEMSERLSTTTLGFGKKNQPSDKVGLEKVALKSFTDFFKPEFLNRFDKAVVFQPFGQDGLKKVLDVKLAQASEHYESEYGIRLSLSEETKQHLVSIAATEPHLGARPLIRALERNVQSAFGRYNQNGMLPEGTHVHVMHCNEVAGAQPQLPDNPLLFMAKVDSSIRKQRPPRVQEAAAESSHEEAAVESVSDPCI